MSEQKIVSRMGFKGVIELKLFGPDGILKDKRVVKDVRVMPNTITTFCDKVVANRMSGSVTDGVISHIAVGTGSGGGASSNSLVTEEDRNAVTSNTQGSAAADNDIVIVGDWAAGDATAAITEAGLFNDASNPGMFAYADFAAINKAAGDTLQITWTLTFGAS